MDGRDPPAGCEGPARWMEGTCQLAVKDLPDAITKPPLLQRSRLTGGGSPNLVGLREEIPVERFIGAANSAH